MKWRWVIVLGFALGACALGACASTGQSSVELPLYVAGTAVTAPVLSVGGVEVSLDRAELAFGPFYLCAGFQAGELCDTARLEWLESVVVQATDPTPQLAGQLRGVSGTVRSWMYDLGITSLLTQQDPLVLAAAAALGGASLQLEGRALLPVGELTFRAAIPVQQSDSTELGVPVVRKSGSDRFEHEVQRGEAGLLVRFEAASWLSGVDFRVYAGEGQCSPGAGCPQSVTVEAGSQAYRSLSNALVAGRRPAFEWGEVFLGR